MDLVQMIEAEHRQVERLLDHFDRAVRSEDHRQQGGLAREILRELSKHVSVEEQVLYPALHRMGASAERLDGLEDHHAVKLTLSELQAMSPRDERFAAKMHVVQKRVRQHCEEEEATVLPRLREELPPDELQRLGAEFEALRRSAPTRPHPGSPDTPPANLFTNAAASILDRLRDGIDEAGVVVRTTTEQLVVSAVRAGRDAADRTRQNGKLLVAQARDTGERALAKTRVLGVEVLQGAAQSGQEVATRIEQRTASASRELTRGTRADGSRSRHPRRRGKPRGARRPHERRRS